VHLKVQVRGLGAGVTGAAHVTDHLSALDHLLLRQAIGVALQMRVVVAPAPAGLELVDRQATALAVEQLLHHAISHREYRRTCVGHDVDGIVHAAFAACIGERIAQLGGQDALHRQQQTGRRIRSLRD